MATEENLLSQLRHNHTPDSVKDQIRKELKWEYGYTDQDINKEEIKDDERYW